MSEENKKLCDRCDICCKYVAMEIDKPTNKTDYDNIIWHLLHENVSIFVDFDNDWYVEFATPCKELDKKTKLCKIYNDRPKICRDYKQADCENYNKEPAEKFYFRSVDDFKKYLKKKKINYKFDFKKTKKQKNN